MPLALLIHEIGVMLQVEIKRWVFNFKKGHLEKMCEINELSKVGAVENGRISELLLD